MFFLGNSLRRVLKWMPPGKALSATKAEAMSEKGERERQSWLSLPAGHSIVAPLWGDMHSSPPNTASRLFCLLHTGLRWGLTPWR